MEDHSNNNKRKPKGVDEKNREKKQKNYKKRQAVVLKLKICFKNLLLQ